MDFFTTAFDMFLHVDQHLLDVFEAELRSGGRPAPRV